MENTPSSYEDGYRGEQSGQAQECEMLYDYPQAASSSQAPGYQPSQGFYSAPTQADIRLPGNANPQTSGQASQQPGPGYNPPPGYPGGPQASAPDYGATQQLVYASYPQHQHPGNYQAHQPFYTLAWRTWNSLWIVLTTLALLLLASAGICYYYLQTRSTPEKTLQTYCNAVKSDDGQALYNTYSSSAQAEVDEPHLQQGLRLIDFLSGGIEDCTIDTNSIQENDPQATARVTFVLYNGRISSPTLHLIYENGQWKIENNPLLP